MAQNRGTPKILEKLDKHDLCSSSCSPVFKESKSAKMVKLDAEECIRNKKQIVDSEDNAPKWRRNARIYRKLLRISVAATYKVLGKRGQPSSGGQSYNTPEVSKKGGGQAIENCHSFSKRQRTDCDSKEQCLPSNAKAGNSLHGISASKGGKENYSELLDLSFCGSSGEYNYYLSYVNKLRACWYKSQNAVILDDQDRVMKVILFVLSLQSIVWKPFLVISSPTTLSVWEAEFLRLAPPPVNIIVYKGNKDVRNSIRSLKFYNEMGCIMFEVLLSSTDVVIEDLENLKCIGWEAIIIDECQRSRMSRHFNQVKMLAADMRLLLVSGQIKDCSTDYFNLLSLLDSGDGPNSDHKKIDCDADTCKLKEILAGYIAFECKSGSSRFDEYWVPVQLSNLQLEQYCATLLSNSVFLCSHVKNVSADALRQVIISTRKCCDHPYLLMDQSLQNDIPKGLSMEEKLDLEIKVSGKLQLLNKILSESKSCGLRVLILFQSVGGSGWNTIGNILDDFICQRFGKDSYVRVDGGYARAKRQASVKMFNDKDSGVFVVLIDDRACLPSIKLSGVDVAIIFNSHWNPLNDLKAIENIIICSQFKKLKVFRLYSSFTVEEKLLILAKNGKIVDGSGHAISWNQCDTLLRWGTLYLFDKLDKFHSCSNSDLVSVITSEESFVNAVLLELLTHLPCSSESNHSSKCSMITEVSCNEAYVRNVSLFGERKLHETNIEQPATFWSDLLEGRHPQWKFWSQSPSRNRKRVQYFENPSRESDFGDDVTKKKRLVINSNDHPINQKWTFKGKRKLVGANKGNKFVGNGSGINQSSPCALKQGISKLCEVLELQENVRDMAVAFFEYIMKDYEVSWEAVSTKQAFQVALCWAVAALLKQKIDQKNSLTLAKLHLDFDCKEEEVEYIYLKLQNTKEEFINYSENVSGLKMSEYSRTSTSMTSDKQDLEGGKMPMCFHSHNKLGQLLHAPTEDIPSTTCDEHQKLASSYSAGINLHSSQSVLEPSDVHNEVVAGDNIVKTTNAVQPKEEFAKDEYHNQISSYSTGMKDYCPLSDHLEHRYPAKDIQTFHSALEPSNLHNEVVAGENLEKTTSAALPNEEIGTDQHQNEVSSYCTRMKDCAPPSDPLEHDCPVKDKQTLQSVLEPTDLHNEVVAVDNLENTTSAALPNKEFGTEHQNEISSYCTGMKNYAPPSDPLEHDCPIKDIQSSQSLLEPTDLNNVVVIGDNLENTTNAPQPNEENGMDEHQNKISRHCTGMKDYASASDPLKHDCPIKDVQNWQYVLEPTDLHNELVAGDNLEKTTNAAPPSEEIRMNEHQNEVSNYCTGMKDYAPPSDPLEHDCPIKDIQTLHSVLESTDLHNELVAGDNLVKPNNAIQLNEEIGMDEHRNEVSAVMKKCAPLSNLQQHGSPVKDMQTLQSVFEPSNLRNEVVASDNLVKTTNAMQHSEEIGLDGYHNEVSGGMKDCAPLSDPLEHHNPVRDVQTSQSVLEPSILHNEVAAGDNLVTTTNAIQLNKEIVTGTMTSERATKPKISQHNRASSQSFGGLTALGSSSSTGRSLVPAETNIVEGNSLSSQLPVSAVPSSPEGNISAILTSLRIQHNPNAGRHAIQEDQIPRQPSLENPTELHSFSTMHPTTITSFPLQQSTSMAVRGSEIHVQNLRDRTTITSSVFSPTQASPMTPVIPQSGCSNLFLQEMKKIGDYKEQALKQYENKVLQLTSECSKEIEEIHKKFNKLFQDARIELAQTSRNIDTYANYVYSQKLLADAMKEWR